MKRLEESYLLVEKTIVNHTNKAAEKLASESMSQPVNPVSETAQAVSPSADTEQSVLSVSEEVPVASVSVREKPPATPQSSTSVPQPLNTAALEPEPVMDEALTPISETDTSVVQSNWSSETDTVSPELSPSKPEKPVPLPTLATLKNQREESLPENSVLPPSELVQSSVSDAAPKSAIHNKVVSLSGAKNKLKTPDILNKPSSIETSSVAGDFLFTKEVDDGLQQLLSEWKLFKKSGLFGTGPNGREHPLFKKIANLQIPLLLAGRFEGATQEIKQSITDYMNGWRYEQGIIYQQGEIFEHYLRRVIRQILDLQNK
jgi:hypothetical protein